MCNAVAEYSKRKTDLMFSLRVGLTSFSRNGNGEQEIHNARRTRDVADATRKDQGPSEAQRNTMIVGVPDLKCHENTVKTFVKNGYRTRVG